MGNIRALKQAQLFLDTYYRPDLANLANACWEETTIKISMLPLLKVYYEHLVHHLDEEATNAFDGLRRDFSAYVQQKIAGEPITEEDGLRFLISLAAKYNLRRVSDIILTDFNHSSLPETIKHQLTKLITEQDFNKAKSLVDSTSWPERDILFPQQPE